MGVFAPGVGHAAFRNDGSEMRIGQHVAPRRRRRLPGRQRNDVLAAIRGKTAETIEELQIVTRPACRRRRFRAVAAARLKARHPDFGQIALFELFSQHAAAVGNHDPSH